VDSRSIEEQLHRYYDIVRETDLPPEVEEELNAEADEVMAEIVRRRDEGAYSRFVAEVIAREYARLQRGQRNKPLCACGDALCPLSRGRLPPQLKPVKSRHFGEEDTKELIDEYEERHPEALIIREARQEWEQKEVELERRLRQLISRVKQHRTAAAKDTFSTEV
jgi:hypothetical protein